MINGKALVVAILISLLIGAGGAWYVRGLQADKALSAQHDTYEAAISKAKDEGIAEERRRADAVAQIAEEARKANEKIDLDAAASSAATDSLQHAANVYATTASCDTGPARRGASATRAAMVLSELLAESNKQASDMAKTADDARQRGLTCERAWDSIKGSRGKSG